MPFAADILQPIAQKSVFRGGMLCSLALALTSTLWMSRLAARSTTQRPFPEPQTFYRIPVRLDRAVLDLDRCEDDFLFIVSNRNPSQPVSVSLVREAVSQVSVGSAVRLSEPGAGPRLHAAAVDRTQNDDQAKIPACVRDSNEVRYFDLHVRGNNTANPEEYVRIPARRLLTGSHTSVFVDREQFDSDVARKIAGSVVSELDGGLLDRLQSALGPVKDVDGDGHLAVLLTPWLSRLQSGQSSLRGFVRPGDFIVGVPRPFSNQADVLYLNSTQAMPNVRALLTHELTHAICCSRDGKCKDDWLNEAIAHLAEAQFAPGDWSNLDHRVSRFLEFPHHSSLVVSNYYLMGRWRDHGCRGATFLFLAWCAEQYGDGFLKALINEPDPSHRAIERLLQRPIGDLQRDWMLRLVADSFFAGKTPLKTPLGRFGLAGLATISAEETRTNSEIAPSASVLFRVPARESQRIRIQGAGDQSIDVTMCRVPNEHAGQVLATRTSDGRVLLKLINSPPGAHVEWISVETTGARENRSWLVQQPEQLVLSRIDDARPLLVKACVSVNGQRHVLRSRVPAEYERLAAGFAVE